MLSTIHIKRIDWIKWWRQSYIPYGNQWSAFPPANKGGFECSLRRRQRKISWIDFMSLDTRICEFRWRFRLPTIGPKIPDHSFVGFWYRFHVSTRILIEGWWLYRPVQVAVMSWKFSTGAPEGVKRGQTSSSISKRWPAQIAPIQWEKV